MLRAVAVLPLALVLVGCGAPLGGQENSTEGEQWGTQAPFSQTCPSGQVAPLSITPSQSSSRPLHTSAFGW